MELTATALQVVQPNANVIYTNMPIPGNCSIVHRSGSGLVKLRGLSNTQCRSRFKVSFGANVSIPTDATAQAITLAITVDGQPQGSSTMIVTPRVVDAFFNVYTDIYLEVMTGCCSTISVKNLTPIAVNVQNANLIVERVA